VPLEVTFNGRAKDPWGAERLGFTLEGSLNRRDFDLQWNIALETGGFLVGDVVKVTINAELVR
jgi:polyisoprenoid-binding protein YceI